MQHIMASFIRRSFRILSNIVKLQPERIYRGVDLQGNKYYEIFPQRYFFGLLRNSRNVRLVEPPVILTNPTGETIKVTNEWDSWLRKRRDDPPTLEELEYNIEYYNAMQQKIHRSDKKSQVRSLKSEKQEQTVDSWTSGES